MTPAGTAAADWPPAPYTRAGPGRAREARWWLPSCGAQPFTGPAPRDGIDLLYSRYGNNPNQLAVAARTAALEGTESALALASGMGRDLDDPARGHRGGRPHIVASRHLYGATHALLSRELPRRGVNTTFVDPADPRRLARGHDRGPPASSSSSFPRTPPCAYSTSARPATPRAPPARSSPPT